MNHLRTSLLVAACLIASASLAACKKSPATSPVGEDMKGVAKETEKTAKDIGRATVDLADQAGKRIQGAANQAGESGDDAWITTKVKSDLTAHGLDPLHVHVDTAAKVVTLSGTVETAADQQKAVSLAKAVKGVTGVEDHLFVGPARR
jgi:osmotically-inducible protein OsmY